MINSKCYIALSFFNKKELRELDDFLQSPFFNKDKSIIRLYQWFKKHFEKTQRRSLTKLVAYTKTFPDKSTPGASLNTQQLQALNSVLSKLTKLVFKYMKHKAMEDNEAYNEHLLLESFLQRNATELFKQYWRQIAQQTNQPDDISSKAYHDRFLLEYDFSRWNLLQKRNIQQRDNLQIVSDNLTTYYLTCQFQLVFEMLAMQRTYKTDYDIDFLPALFEVADLPRFKNNPLIQTYMTAVRMFKDEDFQHFERLKDLLRIHNDINDKAQNDLYIMATNFCTSRIIAGQTEYLEELSQIYKIMSEKNLLAEGEYIPVDKIKNIISVGCQLQHFDWTKQIIEANRERIAPHLRDSVYHFGLGAIHFYQNDFKTAVNHLIRVEDIDINYALDGKFLLQ